MAVVSAIAAPAEDDAATGTTCVLKSIQLYPLDRGAQLDIMTDGNPTALGTRVEPREGIVLDLSGCVPGPQLTGQSFPLGLVSALEIVHRSSTTGPVTALVIKTRQPFEYSVSSRQDSVQVLLRPDGRPKSSTTDSVAAERIRVMEPLPLQPSSPEAQPPRPQTQRPRARTEAVASPPATSAATQPSSIAGLLAGARLSVSRAPRYDPAYQALPYPEGDPGWESGSGVDLVVRAYRHQRIDLQQLIHEDILIAASDYGIQEPDTNIDHRRIRNLAVYLSRHAQSLPVDSETTWQAGDIVLWARDNRVPNHVGIISDRLGQTGHPLVIHHVEDEPPVEGDVLFAWPVRAHYRWLPTASQ